MASLQDALGVVESGNLSGAFAWTRRELKVSFARINGQLQL